MYVWIHSPDLEHTAGRGRRVVEMNQFPDARRVDVGYA